MINYLSGDATNPQLGNNPKFILHVVNNLGGWGAGFVLAISKRFKLPEVEYRNWATQKYYDKPFKLGEILITEIPNSSIRVIHLLAQNGYMSIHNPQPLDYKSLESCLVKAFKHIDSWHGSAHMPKIGSGLGGGNWSKIEDIITNTSSKYKDLGIFVYNFKL